MAKVLAAGLVALALMLTGCGGGPDSDESKRSDRSTTSTSAGSSSTTATTLPAARTIAGAHALAAIVVQIDDPLRRNAALADPCIHGPRDQCTGNARSAYTTLEDLGGAVSVLTDSVTKGQQLYIGDLPDELVGLYDATLDAGVSVKAASTAAQRACLPEASSGCDDASAKLDDALIELYKAFNEWRKLL